MGAEAILLMLSKLAAGVGALLIAALGWSIKKILGRLEQQLQEIQVMTLAHKEQLATGAQSFRDFERRIKKLEDRDEKQCRTCRFESAMAGPALTPAPPRED